MQRWKIDNKINMTATKDIETKQGNRCYEYKTEKVLKGCAETSKNFVHLSNMFILLNTIKSRINPQEFKWTNSKFGKLCK